MIYPRSLSSGLFPLLRQSQRTSLILRSPANLRPFSQHSQLLLLSPASGRPQLPFLAPPSSAHSSKRNGGQWQFARLLTTRRKRFLKEQLWLAGRYTFFGWTTAVLLLIIGFGVQNEFLERKHPTPPEWKWVTRMNYRNAKAQEDPEFNGTGLVDWASTGNMWRNVIRRLEDPKKDGAGVREQIDGGIYVADLGKAGYNVQRMSFAWKKGYYEALMGAAKAAEHLDGWVKDNTRNIAFPGDVVIGPSNPNPKPIPSGAKSPPREEDCSPAFESSEYFYLKILTTKGFTGKEKLDAALAYADWLDFKKLPESAEETYRWALDIARDGLLNPDEVVDPKTGVIHSHAPHVSANILLTSTSLAVHHARNSNVSAALPIFLSVLRARRALLPEPPATPIVSEIKDQQKPSFFMGVVSLFKNLLVPPPYPPPPPTGDEPPYRDSGEICEEAGLMANIGEILFATASSNDGLAWTRDAVDIAEAHLVDHETSADGRARCSECLDVGLENWRKMVRKLVREEQAQKKQGTPSGIRSWFGGSSAQSTEGRWAAEEKVVDRRMQRARELKEQHGLVKVGPAGGGPLLFG
ncbi:hypothetical protein L228DRAFT_251413 [Xylona heveae TC161]|uniref:MFS maltose permease n=1 Tax=Xylona heveae (strain CBS 132557 / TC161) TaxID=1328760 RepID=A0A164ZMV2_XYLHT|nr:hypothetical protein L228DRAFT_251413 [Xylona heveae TC161]KZF19291.1 hypothetical protein L228DRAFT_251413 [Xylona heveae TC161]